MKYFYLLFLILSLFSFTLEQPYMLRKCLSECRRLSNPQNRKRCEDRCHQKYGGF